MPLRISFWHYSLPLTNSPVSLLVNLFFFSSLFSLSGWDIFISSVGFLSLSRTRICLPASPSLCSCQLFWHLCVANKPNWKYLCINKWGRGAVWKRRETDQSCDTSRRQYFRLSICLSIYLSATPPCAASWSVRVTGNGRVVQMKGDSGHVAAATLEPQSSVSVADSPRPSICPRALKGTFVLPQGSFRTHAHTYRWRQKEAHPLLTGQMDTRWLWERHFRITLIASHNGGGGLCC